MARGTETERATLGKIVYIARAAIAADNVLAVFFTVYLITVRNACVFAERAGREWIPVGMAVFFQSSALLFLHCSTLYGNRQVAISVNNTVSVAPRIPPTALTITAGNMRTPLSAAKEAV